MALEKTKEIVVRKRYVHPDYVEHSKIVVLDCAGCGEEPSEYNNLFLLSDCERLEIETHCDLCGLTTKYILEEMEPRGRLKR